jgi:hypothetical protein
MKTHDDEEGEDGDDEVPLAKRIKPTQDPVFSVAGDGREAGQKCMHVHWGECTLLAAADGGWNVQCASDKAPWYAEDHELSPCR